MRNGIVIVVVLSLTAIAAAAHLAVSAPTAAPVASPADEGTSSTGRTPPSLILAAAQALRSVGNDQAVDPEEKPAAPCGHRAISLAEFDEILSQMAEKDRARKNTARLFNLRDTDDVTMRIRGELERLAGLTDDEATQYVDLSDDEYRAAQAESVRVSSGPRGWLPDRPPSVVGAWLREPIDLSDVEPSAVVREAATLLIRSNRLRLARECRFHLARLSPDSIREHARSREFRRPIATFEDRAEFDRAQAAWRTRFGQWVTSEEDGPDDARELGELVRTIPSRLWEQDFDSVTR